MAPIFNENELSSLVKRNESIDDLEVLKENERKEGIKKAFEDIKNDYNTHDVLLNEFKEAEGMILMIRLGTYLGEYNIGSVEPPYLSFKNFSPKVLMYFNKSRDNHIFLGDWDNYRFDDGRVRSVINVMIPDKNQQKIYRDANALQLLDSEVFAQAYIHSKFETELSLDRKEEDPQDRDWRMNGGFQNRKQFVSKSNGEDLINLYKGAVKSAVRDYHNIMGYISTQICSDSHNFRLLNRDLYHHHNFITKIEGFANKELFL